MPPLNNNRHEKFANEVAKGVRPADAYAKAGYAATARGNDVCASRLLKDVNISARVEELQERAATRTVVTVAGITEDLLRIAAKAEALESPAALNVARNAKMDAAKLNGLVIDRKEVGAPGEFDDKSVDELRKIVEEGAKKFAGVPFLKEMH
ncbi:hypothetical protein CHELA41_24472 [Hyphomicrobiales bacterium]|nr:hypothetical protein CHELA41_24472 [Hyphomicrobiales bacterium]